VPGNAQPSFWDMWDSLSSADRHADAVRALFTYAGRDAAPPPPMPMAAVRPSKTPAASAGGFTPPQEDDDMSTLIEGLRQRLGFAENADEGTILTSLDEHGQREHRRLRARPGPDRPLLRRRHRQAVPRHHRQPADRRRQQQHHVAHATAAGRVCGVSKYDAASGGKVGIYRGNSRVVFVNAGGNIAAFAEVEVGSNGQAVTKAAGVAVGYAVTAATSGNDAEISLY
jgi:hypothetical protein